MSYRVLLLSPPAYIHIAALAELRDGLEGGLREAELWSEDGRPIVLGGHLPIALPLDAIILNTEVAGSAWFTRDYLSLMSNHEVWDYSLTNIKWLSRQSIMARHCPVGYHECLTRIERAPEQDIDVLFYGSMTPRRAPIWESVCQTGLNCVHLFGVYGAARDEYIARSKVVLDMAAYEQSPRNDVRLSYLWANKVFVVEERKYGATRVADACRFWINAPSRDLVALDDYERCRSNRQADYLRSLLAPIPEAA